VAQIERLAEERFDGVHFNLEPLRDGQRGYLELLSEVRNHFGQEWTISQATPRSAPFGVSVGFLRRSFWSGGFYRATMDIADQTVLMAYETKLFPPLSYVAFVGDQTRRLVEWACRAERHEVLIGIPSYADTSPHSDPAIENISNAALGVRSALESLPGASECFRGVAIYADWVTDSDEWREFDQSWRRGTAH
jgi:spore germination protein YaaH